ncbi:MAG: DegT/DnrJ/EryC1/StrS aminotransferase family protein [Candidatus Wallbacteria bacterium]|nr:DegT/DnrJ/EryC1/StrS aminotransferase family protein [Candidatus Wallbacteria bacterium]
MIPPHRLDIDAPWLFEALASPWGADPAEAARRLEEFWAPAGDGIACLSVRSAFALLLQAAGWAAGDEVVCTAINIPDMRRIITEHRLTATVVDVAEDTLAPEPGALERALGPRVRAVLVAHLFGGRVKLEPILALARPRGIMVIEDAAQAFRGPRERGHPEADVSLFSFGMLKTATACGGALTRVRNPALLTRMRQIQAGWPLQPAGAYFRRLLRMCAIAAGQIPPVYGALSAGLRGAGVSLGAVMRAMSRGLPDRADASYLDCLQLAPCAPLLNFLTRRLQRFDPERLLHRAAAAESVLSRFPASMRVGTGLEAPSWWLAPLLVPAPGQLRKRLLNEGFDVSDASNVCAIGEVPRARAMIEHLVFLPVAPEYPPRVLERLADCVQGAIAETSAPGAAPC